VDLLIGGRDAITTSGHFRNKLCCNSQGAGNGHQVENSQVRKLLFRGGMVKVIGRLWAGGGEKIPTWGNSDADKRKRSVSFTRKRKLKGGGGQFVIRTGRGVEVGVERHAGLESITHGDLGDLKNLSGVEEA